jgi:CRISPR/Cas system endoribonuclease Cas6 (RAMP superfamily)
VEAPDVRARIAGHRLFHYLLPRHSYRQDKWMDFDGMVGYLDLEGDLDAGMPFARAAEVLHFGQKATFGLGKVRVLVLE